MSQRFAVASPIERRKQMHRYSKPAPAAENPQDVVLPALAVPPDLRRRCAIVDCYRPDLNFRRGISGRFEQRGPKRKEMIAGTGRPFGEKDDRLLTLGRTSDSLRLILRSPAMLASNVKRMVLVGEPVDQSVSKIVLRDEGRSGRSTENQDIEPADVIADEQRMRLNRAANEGRANSDSPCCRSQESPGPSGSPENIFRSYVDRTEGHQQ